MTTPTYQSHLFICTNIKENGACCGLKGGPELRTELKNRISKSHPSLKTEVRINSAGCLGLCDQGIAAVCYPKGEWKTNLTLADLNGLEEWVVNLCSSPNK